MVLQGKKIRDDNKTLLQSGICHDNTLDALGFTLEPNASQASQILNPDHPLLLRDTPEPISRYSICLEYCFYIITLFTFEFFNL